MQIDTQTVLEMAERTGKICFFDIESSGLKADYHSMLVGSIKPYGKRPVSFAVDKPGDDKKLVKQLRDALEQYAIWVTYYGKGFDIPMLRSRLLFHSMTDIKQSHHLDMYFMLRYNTLTARRSQAHLLEWMQLPEKKLTLSADVWAAVAANPKEHLKTLVRRCEQDVIGLEGLYRRTRHLVKDLKRS